MSSELCPDRGEAEARLPGIIVALADLGAGALISEEALAHLLGRHRASVKRAVRRGELPPPVRFLGRPTWTAGAILRHMEDRLEKAAREAEKAARRAESLRP
jgi:predicted DNA-binding transcriptional regulator AlpA